MSKKKRAPADMVAIHACCAGLDVHKKTVVTPRPAITENACKNSATSFQWRNSMR